MIEIQFSKENTFKTQIVSPFHSVEEERKECSNLMKVRKRMAYAKRSLTIDSIKTSWMDYKLKIFILISELNN